MNNSLAIILEPQTILCLYFFLRILFSKLLVGTLKAKKYDILLYLVAECYISSRDSKGIQLYDVAISTLFLKDWSSFSLTVDRLSLKYKSKWTKGNILLFYQKMEVKNR